MSAAVQELTQEQKEEFFEEILKLYDLTDEVVNAIGARGVTNRVMQLELAAPLVEQSNQSIDMLCQMATEIEKGEESATAERRAMMEGAFHNFFLALRRFTDDVDKKLLRREG